MIISIHAYSYPCQQALGWCRGHRLSVGPLGRAQLGRHGGGFVYEGQRLRAVLGLAVLRSVPLVAICVVVEVWEGDSEAEVPVSILATVKNATTTQWEQSGTSSRLFLANRDSPFTQQLLWHDTCDKKKHQNFFNHTE